MKVNEVTGCAHIKNLDTYKHHRVCSNCEAEMPEEIIESELVFCWRCGVMFDHTEDEPNSEC